MKFTLQLVSVVAAAGIGPCIIGKSLPLEASTGRGLLLARLSACAQLARVSFSRATPVMGLDAWVAFSPSSIGQYARGDQDGMRRRKVLSSALAPCPRRRRMPDASRGTYTSSPDTSQREGQLLTSPTNRVRRLVMDVAPFMVHRRVAASVKLAVPSAWAVKSGLATTLPLMPLRTSRA